MKWLILSLLASLSVTIAAQQSKTYLAVGIAYAKIPGVSYCTNAEIKVWQPITTASFSTQYAQLQDKMNEFPVGDKKPYEGVYTTMPGPNVFVVAVRGQKELKAWKCKSNTLTIAASKVSMIDAINEAKKMISDAGGIYLGEERVWSPQ